ncbi:MAG: lysylphosphatidylglycerol synthase transmembrane domain-containing protein [Chloroflexota bacterium]|nr:flippase-like domain-containing protein [Dehalococcoidia bacterium]MDW8252378.1 lysylphosphatidylglycerol synthase transmembrane domain-containing protein [Chloroflexota bacterium]
MWLRLVVGLLISAGAIALTLRLVDLEEVTTTLRSTNPVLTLAALGSFLLTTYAKAARWTALSGLPQRASRRLLPGLVIGQLVNTLIPARLGDLARAVVAGEATGLGKAFLLGTVVLEKLIDGLCVLLVAALLLPFLRLPEWLVASGLEAALGVLLLGAGIATLLLVGDRLLALAAQLLRAVPGRWSARLTRALADAIRGLGGLRTWPQRWWVSWWSFVAWTTMIATNVLVFQAVGLEAELSAAVIVLLAVTVGGSVPSVPGRVGVFHSLVAAPLILTGVDPARAVSAAVVLHLLVVSTQLVLGVLFIWRASLDPRQLAALK